LFKIKKDKKTKRQKDAYLPFFFLEAFVEVCFILLMTPSSSNSISFAACPSKNFLLLWNL
jgi:hypothetical protein